MSIPYIDPTVEHVGVSWLKRVNASELLTVLAKKTIVIDARVGNPVAVVMSFESYLQLQEMLKLAQDEADEATKKLASKIHTLMAASSGSIV